MDNCHKGLLEVIKNDEQFTFLREKYRDEINMLENLNNKRVFKIPVPLWYRDFRVMHT